MQAHANDLRSEVANDWNTLSPASQPSGSGLDEFVHQAASDWRKAPLTGAVRELAIFVEKVTRAPALCSEADVANLRSAGWNDRAIHDAVQVVSYFNYINRVADALGVDPEEGLPRWGFDES